MMDEGQSFRELFLESTLSLRGCETDEEILSKIRKDAAWIEHRWPNQETPLIKGAYLGKAELVKELLKHGANLEAIDIRGQTALHAAVQYGRSYVVEILLEAGANINASNGTGMTPTMISVLRDRIFPGTGSYFSTHTNTMMKILKLLTQRGADVEKQDQKKRTALHIAVTDQKFGAVRVLLEHGANVESAATGGYRPLHLAAAGGLKILRLLVNKGADIDSRNDDGMTPLHLAVRRGNPFTVKFLIENGAAIDILTNSGQTALDLAHRAQKQTVMDSLKEATKKEGCPALKGSNDKNLADSTPRREFQNKRKGERSPCSNKRQAVEFLGKDDILIQQYEKELRDKTSEFEIKLEQAKCEVQSKAAENKMLATEIKKLKAVIRMLMAN